MRKPDLATCGALGLFLLAFVLSGEAKAQPESFCAPAKDFTVRLAKVGERPLLALNQAEFTKIIFVNGDTGDFTIANLDHEGGTICTAAYGSGFILNVAAAQPSPES